jgi:predicted nucleic acid-binding protein
LIFVDTNVLLDVVIDDPHWGEWSTARLEEAELLGPLLANDIVYAEFSQNYASVEETDEALEGLGVTITATPRDALFLAGKAYRKYRGSHGSKTGVLPDFFIGAHAALLGVPLLTRDLRRYRSYFPSLTLITPD